MRPPFDGGPHGFWKFTSLRQQAYWRKVRGEGPPFSDDPSLARYHFCNVYREADTGSVWFQANRSRAGQADRWTAGTVQKSVLWESLLYRLVNRISTMEAFRDNSGEPFPLHGNGKSVWLKWLGIRMRSGEKVFTGRHLNVGAAKYATMVGWLEVSLQKLHDTVFAATTLEGVTKALLDVPSVGRFFAWQVTCDLLESGLLPFTEDDWCYLGPGALNGIDCVVVDDLVQAIGLAHGIIDRKTTKLDVARILMDRQTIWLSGLPLEPPPQSLVRDHMTLKNVEHALCEYARYVRASNADPGKGVGLEVKPWAK